MERKTVTFKGRDFNFVVKPKQAEAFSILDGFAKLYASAMDPKRKLFYFEAVVHYAKPFMKASSIKFFHRISPDAVEEMEAILMQDLWRLIKQWKDDNRCFHHLLLKQIRNKCINEINSYNRPQESRRSLDLARTSSLDAPIYDGTTTAHNLVHDDLLSPQEVTERKCFTSSLLSEIKDEKTRRIIELTMEGDSVKQILTDEAVGGRATRAVHRRQELCRPEMIALLFRIPGEPKNRTINRFLSAVRRTYKKRYGNIPMKDMEILQQYCQGYQTDEISRILSLTSVEVKSCISKYKSIILAKVRTALM